MVWVTRTPKHVADKIEQNRRAAKLASCPRCGADVWTGDDDDRASIKVTVDAVPVDRITEVIALLRGLASFDLRRRGPHTDIWHREPWHVHSPRNGARIHIEHSCNQQPARITPPSRKAPQ